MDDPIQLISDTSLGTVKNAIDSRIGKFTKKEIVALCPGLSASTVERHLKKLVAEGALEKLGSGRATVYVRRDGR